MGRQKQQWRSEWPNHSSGPILSNKSLFPPKMGQGGSKSERARRQPSEIACFEFKHRPWRSADQCQNSSPNLTRPRWRKTSFCVGRGGCGAQMWVSEAQGGWGAGLLTVWEVEEEAVFLLLSPSYCSEMAAVVGPVTSDVRRSGREWSPCAHPSFLTDGRVGWLADVCWLLLCCCCVCCGLRLQRTSR